MMMLSEASVAMQGQLNGSDRYFKSVEIDTRRLEQNALYFAIHGEAKNGHDYIPQAFERGAAAVVADELFPGNQSACHVRVGDTTIALGMLAKFWREGFSVPVVGVTGSNGKTTVCGMLSTVFGESIPGIAPQGSFNNHWGVPLTLLKLREQHRSAIIEMGMNHAGELSYLGDIVKPTIGLITNAAAAHLEGLKTVEGVAKAKGELIDSVATDGTVILNRDDHFYTDWKVRAGDRKTLSFGTDVRADVRILDAAGQYLTLDVLGQTHEFEFKLLGRHNQLNAAATVAVAVAAGLRVDAIHSGLSKVCAVKGRLDAQHYRDGVLLIDDSYNANKASMRAAIDVLAEQAGTRVLILGAMGELGANSREIHRQVGAYARSKGVELLLTLVDRDAREYREDMNAYLSGFGEDSQSFAVISKLVDRLEALQVPYSVLVKGSRFTAMERVIEEIRSRREHAC